LECAKALLAEGAAAVSLFVVHAEFPHQSWKKFLPENCPIPIAGFYITDSVPDVAYKLRGVAPFTIISIAQDVKNFLDIIV
jgi:hypothetical protein